MALKSSALRSRSHIDAPFAFMIVLIVLLWVAGGSSRADVMGQVVVRAGCWMLLTAAILFGPKPKLADVRFVAILLLVTIALPLVQLVPLPPSWWQALPGREILLIPDEAAPWRPLTMTPGATRNAFASLVVPATTLLLLIQANEKTRNQLPTALLTMISLAVFLGLLQFSGAEFNNPLINDPRGQVTGIFANRNHLALLIAIGCLIAPVWAFMDRDGLRWRGPLAVGLVLLFVLTILATGSRSGMLLGALALALALMLVGRRLRRRLAHSPGWVFPALIMTCLVVIAGFVGLSFVADRADAITRLIALESRDDMRLRALPTVLSMIGTYMPFGSGFGGFDQVFRIHEPASLLNFAYFNQAHNDFLGVALDGGVAGICTLAVALTWWLTKTFRVWRAETEDTVTLGRLGSAIILLILLASVTDYPARTPTIMAIVVIAAFWIARASKPQPALRKRSAHL